MRLYAERSMAEGPLPSGMSRLSLWPSKRRRRSNAEAMSLALSALVKIPVAAECISSRAASLTGVMATPPCGRSFFGGWDGHSTAHGARDKPDFVDANELV